MTDVEVNSYSPKWFESFLLGREDPRTDVEVEFLVRQLPPERFWRVLDVCCGTGRHSRRLAALGFDVLGVDRSETALFEARRFAPEGAEFLAGDMRALDGIPGRFDAAICMWQSFGYFDADQNMEILAAMGRKVRPGGRVILDVYDRSFMESREGTRRIDGRGEPIVETVALEGDRLKVRLDYGKGGASEEFEWQIFTADALIELAGLCGLDLVRTAAAFDETRAPDGTDARMQLVFERARG